MSGNPIYLRVPRRQFYCVQCQRYSTERLEWVDSQRRHTRRYESNIYERVLGSSLEKVARVTMNLPVRFVQSKLVEILRDDWL